MIRKFFKFVLNGILILFVLFVILVILTPTSNVENPNFQSGGGRLYSQTPAEKLETMCHNLPPSASSDEKDLCGLVNRYGAKRATEMIIEYGKNTQ